MPASSSASADTGSNAGGSIAADVVNPAVPWYVWAIGAVLALAALVVFGLRKKRK